jgi:putative ABC transport system permease protein
MRAALPQTALLLRLVLREVPRSLRQFAILIACIALGVASIVAVISLSRALNDGLAREGRTILGADAAFTLIQRGATDAELSAIRRQGDVSTVLLSRAMARATNDESALVEIKAVDGTYPATGQVQIEGAGGPESRPLAQLLAVQADGLPGLVADPVLTARLGIRIGDTLAIGESRVRITAHLASEPDKLSGGFGFGPRVLMTIPTLMATGLVQPGSLTRWSYRLLLPDGAGDRALNTALEAIARDAPEAGWQVATRMRASPNLQRQIARFTQFLALVGLTALLVGGIGVANATRAFSDGQVMRIATLKSLGASRSFVFLSSLAQVLAFALIGIAIGLVVGSLLPRLALGLARELLPIPLDVGLYPRELLLGLGYGLITALTFALLPLLKARAVPASTLFRDEAGGSLWRPGPAELAIVALALAAFAGIIMLTASERFIALVFLGAASGAIVTLRLVAMGVMRVARAMPHPRAPELRLALANLHRRGSLTPSVIQSLGLGLTLLVALTLIDVNLTRQFRASLPGIAPSFFFIDIPSREMDRFEAFLKTETAGGTIERVPQLRGRVLELNGVPAAQIRAAERVSWFLDGDRGITYEARPPEGSRIASGEWWPADYRGPPLVSFAKDIADELGLKAGDSVTVNVLGRRITARIANLREVRWQRLGINFVMVFSPNTFAGAPHTFLATLAMPEGAGAEGERLLARNVAQAFPAISSVRVKDALDAADKIVSQLALAIRLSSAVALAASILVLGGALAASARTRQRESVILKTLGATRATLLKAMIAEYALLGGIAVIFGIACGAGAAALVVSGIMNLEFEMPWLSAFSIAASAFIATIILGLLGTWHILGQKPAPYLRHA